MQNCEKKSCPVSACFKNYVFFWVTLVAIVAIWLTHTNEILFYKINAMHSYLPDMVWNVLNLLAYSKFFILPIVLVALTWIGRRDKIANTLVVIGSYYVVFQLLKIFIGEPRPYVVLDQHSFFWLNHFENAAKSAYRSFPSGHAGNMAVFVFSLIYLFFQNNTLAKIGLIGLLVLTMLARICTGWHWPIDVLSGGLIGYVIVNVGYCLPLDKLCVKKASQK
jgi:membrane-associated phospholipid phosphatase